MKPISGIPALLLSAFLTACSTGSKPGETNQADEKSSLPIIQLANRDATVDHDYAGQLEAVQKVEIRARVAGYLDRILVDEGKPVRKGQLLFQLNDAEYRAEVARAQASLESATAQAKASDVEIGRVKLLVDKNVISPSELKLAKARRAVSQGAIDEARAALGKARLHVAMAGIRAPFDGVIDRLPFKQGSLIEEGALLTTVSDIREMYAYFNVSEKEYLGFIKKRKNPDKTTVREVDLLLADDSHYPHKGKIETTETIFADNSGTIAFRARFPNPNRLLRHGATGKVRLTTDVEDALLVPQKAVFEVQDKNFVYVVGPGNKVKTRSFVPRSRVDQFYIVQSGLRPGERIVYEGIQNIREGMIITPKPMPADSIRALYASAR